LEGHLDARRSPEIHRRLNRHPAGDFKEW